MKVRISGRYLWQVDVTVSDSVNDEQLWITTARYDIEDATRITKKFLKSRKNTAKFRNSKIINIESHGTLDA